MTNSARDQLIDFWWTGIDAVSGKQSVIAALTSNPPFQPDLIIAIGKAASGMCLGALQTIPNACPALVVTKYGHVDKELLSCEQVEVLESAHPIPDNNSLNAGSRVLDAVSKMPQSASLLLLVSGGASALAESLPSNVTLESLQAMTDDMLSSGKTIAQINAKRKQVSRIKDGKLAAAFNGKSIVSYIISDVEGDDITTIGSGTGDCRLAKCNTSSNVIASNHLARTRVAAQAIALGYPVITNTETLYGDVFTVASQIATTLKHGESGIYVWGGEPTIRLPKNPGNGGRNQSLALALAQEISGCENMNILVAGTDGTDGPTDAAGGIVNGKTVTNTQLAQTALDAADAGTYLRASGDIFISGPTNTNVMDLVIAMVE